MKCTSGVSRSGPEVILVRTLPTPAVEATPGVVMAKALTIATISGGYPVPEDIAGDGIGSL